MNQPSDLNMVGVKAAAPVPANDDPYIRITMRHDRATVVVIGDQQIGPRMSRLFGGSESAAAIDYAHEIADVLGTRVRYRVINGVGKSAGWLPRVSHMERAS